MIWLAYAAPFGAYRDFSAGFFRPTSPFATPSALYGLVLNIAGIETRAELGPKPTEIVEGLPVFRIASAAVGVNAESHSFAGFLEERGTMPGRGALYQQLHTVPVGEASKEWKPRTKGNKHHIAPAWREVLVGVRGVVAVDADLDLEARLVAGVEKGMDGNYGLPFAGDNNFFLEELALLEPSNDIVTWMVLDDERSAPHFRLTTWVDRRGMKGTRQAVFSLQDGPLASPPPAAWVEVGPA